MEWYSSTIGKYACDNSSFHSNFQDLFWVCIGKNRTFIKPELHWKFSIWTKFFSLGRGECMLMSVLPRLGHCFGKWETNVQIPILSNQSRGFLWDHFESGRAGIWVWIIHIRVRIPQIYCGLIDLEYYSAVNLLCSEHPMHDWVSQADGHKASQGSTLHNNLFRKPYTFVSDRLLCQLLFTLCCLVLFITSDEIGCHLQKVSELGLKVPHFLAFCLTTN